MSRKVISLFAGCGGSSLGYKLAGFQVLAMVEHDPHAAEMYQVNHTDALIRLADIATIDPEKLLADLGLAPGELDILDGSPPCQGFSMAGKRAATDARNQLFVEYIRFLNVIRPRAFVMENVPGLVRGQMRSIFRVMITALIDSGYHVSARILNASHYGVPQNRERVIILGLRNDFGVLPRHPQPNTLPVTFREAVSGLESPGLVAHPIGKALALCRALKPGESGGILHARYGQKRNDFSLIRLHWDKPSPTVCRTIRPGQAGLLHPVADRYLGIDELKRVCSFPDDFVLSGSFEAQWGVLGNAVPPLLMKAIASSLDKQLEGV